MRLLIDQAGGVKCIYGEAIDLSTFGNLKIARGSHVEPDETGQWWADLSPVSGPKLGPFENRSRALSAEVGWLEAHWLTPASPQP
jgi:hypothetical protein